MLSTEHDINDNIDFDNSLIQEKEIQININDNKHLISQFSISVATYNLWNVMFNWNIRKYRIAQMVCSRAIII